MKFTTTITVALVAQLSLAQYRGERHSYQPPPIHDHVGHSHPREIIIPEQRFILDEDGDDDEYEELKHLLDLADLIAYEDGDEKGEHVPPTYIGRHNLKFKDAEKKKLIREREEWNKMSLEEQNKHFFIDQHGEVHETCIKDSDCEETGYVCGIEQPGVCGHKDVFPTSLTEMIGVFTFAFVMGLCTVAGIGGGGIAISLVIAFFNFTTKPAVAISSLSILVCTIMRFVYNFNTMHPEKKGVILIDYSLVTIMMPTTIAGSQFGSVILKTFPALWIQFFLTILLAFLSYQSYIKAKELHTKEQQEATRRQSRSPSSSNFDSNAGQYRSSDGRSATKQDLEGTELLEQQTQSMPESWTYSGQPSQDLSMQRTSDTKSSSRRSIQSSQSYEKEDKESMKNEQPIELITRGRDKDGFETLVIGGKQFVLGQNRRADAEINQLAEIVKQESGHAQPMKHAICLCMLGFVIIMNLLMPSETSASIVGIEPCSANQFSLQLFFIFVCASVTFVAIRINQQEQHLKIKYEVNYRNGDIKFRGDTLTQLTGLGFVGGLVAGALGLGGGSIYNPALLSMGVHPKVSGATGMFLVLFSTVNTCLVNYLNGFLHLNYGFWIAFWSLLGSLLGMQITDRVVQMTGKPSILVWILVFVFVLSTVATPLFGGKDLYYLHKRGENIFAFSSYC